MEECAHSGGTLCWSKVRCAVRLGFKSRCKERIGKTHSLVPGLLPSRRREKFVSVMQKCISHKQLSLSLPGECRCPPFLLVLVLLSYSLPSVFGLYQSSAIPEENNFVALFSFSWVALADLQFSTSSAS